MAEQQKIAIVTGGGAGLGRATALALAAAGWTVAIAGRRAETLDDTAKQAPGTVVPLVADVTDVASVDGLFDAVVARFGRLDLLFNNAGTNARGKPLDEIEPEALRAVVDTNLWGSLLCARAAMRVMKAQSPQGGRIINNGSVSAYAPRPNQTVYTATKHGITGLTKSIYLDGRAFNIASGQIDIGNAASDMSDYMAKGAMQANGTTMPEPRIPASRVAETVLYMASLPLDANIPFLTVMATGMPLYGRG